ncbi:MAG TPA: hypothetical protein VFV72_15165 [Candidatus Limnocylindrales bacterium]|nr:hypothetical protein [Candidatus Limnocylindrales bacterium]
MTPRQPRSQLSGRALAVLAVIGLALAACQPTASPAPSASPTTGTPAPSPAAEASPKPTQNPEAIYAAIEDEVVSIRGLTPKNPVDPKVLDDAGIRKVTEEGFRKDNPRDLVEANERLLKGLGLLEPEASLEDLYIKLLGDQVAGLYSPDDKQLYVVSRSGALGPTEKSTFSHEFTHALQDQNFDLSSLDLSEVGEGDRGIARLALVEGDATLAMTYWQLANLGQMELLQMLGESLNPEVTASLDAMPAVLRESLLFPYTGGLAFVQALQTSGGWGAVNDVYKSPPASTEQILHPEKYVAGETPVDVTVPTDLAAKMGDGWKVGLEDTLGEFQLKVWLEQAPKADGGPSAARAADGWGGDRVALLDGPDGAWAIALNTAWDTPEDATEFIAAARRAVDALPNGGTVEATSATDVSVVLASDAGLVERLGAALGD